jgi:hypothetical protein
MSVCSRCGAQFGCAMAAEDRGDPQPDSGDPPLDRAYAARAGTDPRLAADAPCWCTLLPAVARVPDAADEVGGCWCRACLQRYLDERQSVLTGSVSR